MVENENASRLSKLAVCLLCNCMGMHRFYLGIKGGVLLLVLSLCGIVSFGATTLVAIVMSVIDFYNILSGKMLDGQGKVVTYWLRNE